MPKSSMHECKQKQKAFLEYKEHSALFKEFIKHKHDFEQYLGAKRKRETMDTACSLLHGSPFSNLLGCLVLIDNNILCCVTCTKELIVGAQRVQDGQWQNHEGACLSVKTLLQEDQVELDDVQRFRLEHLPLLRSRHGKLRLAHEGLHYNLISPARSPSHSPPLSPKSGGKTLYPYRADGSCWVRDDVGGMDSDGAGSAPTTRKPLSDCPLQSRIGKA